MTPQVLLDLSEAQEDLSVEDDLEIRVRKMRQLLTIIGKKMFTSIFTINAYFANLPISCLPRDYSSCCELKNQEGSQE